MNKIYMLFLFFFICSFIFSYPTVPDSIAIRCEALKSDTNRCEFLLNQTQLIKGNNPKLAFELAEKALFYAKQANYVQ